LSLKIALGSDATSALVVVGNKLTLLRSINWAMVIAKTKRPLVNLKTKKISLHHLLRRPTMPLTNLHHLLKPILLMQEPMIWFLLKAETNGHDCFQLSSLHLSSHRPIIQISKENNTYIYHTSSSITSFKREITTLLYTLYIRPCVVFQLTSSHKSIYLLI
jgi:hypothetical protein